MASAACDTVAPARLSYALPVCLGELARPCVCPRMCLQLLETAGTQNKRALRHDAPPVGECAPRVWNKHH